MEFEQSCCLALGSVSGLRQLEVVVGGADHRPFAPDLIEATASELSEASGPFDLPAQRLDHLLPGAVAPAAASPLQAGRHRAHQRHLRQPPVAGRVSPAMRRSTWSEVARDAPQLDSRS